MRTILFILSTLPFNVLMSQNIELPKGVVYKYCSEKINSNSEQILKQELSGNKKYSMFQITTFIGPNSSIRHIRKC
jgi:hypothetical protein